MAKRFSAHYVYSPSVGYLKQAVVEVDECGCAVALSLLLEEVEGVEWLPGVIILVADQDSVSDFSQQQLVADLTLFNTYIQTCQSVGLPLRPYLLYPFDFTSMQPVAGTRHKLLR